MNTKIVYLTSKLEKNVALPEEVFNSIIYSIECVFPEDYLAFMRTYNGGEGRIQEGQWARFVGLDELKEENEIYQTAQNAPSLFLVGGNGGTQGFALRKTDGLFLLIDYLEFEDETGEEIGYTFLELLEYLSANF